MISTKGRYAIRFMIDLAEQEGKGPVPLSAVSERQNISKKYMESIVKTLVSAKLVNSSSGKGGGYSLTKTPEEYTVWEILNATEESMSSVACLIENAEKCPREDTCQTVSMWRGYDKVVRDYFSGITIADLANREKRFTDFAQL
ncbi:MAG: Rrf2 family transcriptional regulator [Lachnospiraceae bacterium]|nr:Rrf2 family transcriptional regulator [Lachnospiraceae bacterium]